jgi:hypothetical protein
MLSVAFSVIVMLHVIAACRYFECRYAESHHAEGRTAYGVINKCCTRAENAWQRQTP